MSHTSVRTPARSFVGRAAELVDLQDALASAAAGRGLLVLLTGEPGIGKTRLLQELATLAASTDDWRVLIGRCWEEGGAPPYWPWIQIVREAGGEFATLAGQRAPPGDEAMTSSGVHADTAALTSADPESIRFGLFDVVTQFLADSARERPLLIVVEDLHAADAPSLLLLRFLSAAVSQTRVLLVGSYREGERRVREQAELFADLVRASRRIALRGLSVDEVEAYLAAVAGAPPPRSVSVRLQAATAGNPFFLGEIVRLLSADRLLDDDDMVGDPMLRVPEEVRALIRRRIAGLSHEAVSVLRVSAVVGRDFDLRILQRVSQLSAGRLLDVLSEAVNAGVVVEGPSGGRYSFVHELVRETLYDELPASRRLELHLTIGQVLEELSRSDPGPELSEIAHHLALAVPLGDVARAVDFLVRAGDRASAVLAYEEAVIHYARALALLADEESGSARRRCELLLRLGDAQWRAGDTRSVGASFQEAARLARGLGDAETLARAALGYVVGLGGFLLTARYEAGASGIGLLEEALAALPEQDSSLRAHILARLAVELWSPHEVERRVELSRAAIEMARRLDDAETLATALHCGHWALASPEMVMERLAATDEMLEVARRTGNQEIAFLAHNARFRSFLELCDGDGIDGEIESMTQLAERMHQPFYRWHTVCLRTIRAILDGRFTDAERLAEEGHGLARVRHSEYAEYVFRHAQLVTIRWAQGRLGAVRDVISEHGERFPWISRWREVLLAAELGDEQAARLELERYAQRDFYDLPLTGLWMLHLCALAEACALAGDAGRASRLYELLLPFVERHVVSIIQQPFGPVALRLGMLARVLRRWEEAERHFLTAMACCRRMNARAFDVRILSEHAKMIRARGRAGDERTAAALLDDAARLADELQIARPAERRPAGDSSFRREGEFWTIAYAGDTFRVRHVKGLRYLAFLLGSPGKDIHVLELARAAEGSPGGRRPASLDAPEPVLDAEAKESYRRRLHELGEDLREARDWQDPERVAHVETEIDALTTALARAVGFGGRDRQFTSPAERARVSVTKAIRSAIRAIDRHSPPLGAHLADSIRTGRFCSYAPPGEAPPDWSL